MKTLSTISIGAILCAVVYYSWTGSLLLWLDRIPDIASNTTLLILTISSVIIISTLKTVDLNIKNTNTKIGFVIALTGNFMLICRFLLCLVAEIFNINIKFFILLLSIFQYT